MYEFCFLGTDQWFTSPFTAAEAVALHAMRCHGGRVGRGVVLRRDFGDSQIWAPRARARRANSVEIRRRSTGGV